MPVTSIDTKVAVVSVFTKDARAETVCCAANGCDVRHLEGEALGEFPRVRVEMTRSRASSVQTPNERTRRISNDRCSQNRLGPEWRSRVEPGKWHRTSQVARSGH